MQTELTLCYLKAPGQQGLLILSNAVHTVGTPQTHSNRLQSSASRIYTKPKSIIFFARTLRFPHFTPYVVEGFWHKPHENLSKLFNA